MKKLMTFTKEDLLKQKGDVEKKIEEINIKLKEKEKGIMVSGIFGGGGNPKAQEEYDKILEELKPHREKLNDINNKIKQLYELQLRAQEEQRKKEEEIEEKEKEAKRYEARRIKLENREKYFGKKSLSDYVYNSYRKGEKINPITLARTADDIAYEKKYDVLKSVTTQLSKYLNKKLTIKSGSEITQYKRRYKHIIRYPIGGSTYYIMEDNNTNKDNINNKV